MRALRNKVGVNMACFRPHDVLIMRLEQKHHYQDLPDNVKRHLGPLPEGFLAYFTRRFPRLFLHVWAVVQETGMAGESEFRPYFEP